MESANLHGRQHHQLQDQLVGSSSPLATYGVGSMLMNPSHNLSSNSNAVLQNDHLAPDSLNSSMVQGLGFQWHNGNNNVSTHDLQLASIKGELSDSYNKLNEMIPKYSLSSLEGLHSQATISYLKAEQQREFLSGGLNGPSLGSFSQILPTINISSLGQSSTLAVSSSPLEINLQALDLWASGRFNGNIGMYKDSNALSHGLDLMQQPVHSTSNSHGKISPFNGFGETKRASTSLLEPKVTQASQKKPRSDSRSSPAFKVRKEKLGDRIAALQQLVAPFGKTDTASVLMEAIGYIKFLQNQVETLSVPYMKSSRNHKTTRSLHGGLAADGGEEPRRDLRSRGLCLVPLSCLSYITDGGGVVWPPPNFTSDT